MKKVSGVVVLYNPKVDFLRNINSYIDGLDSLLIVDNSDQPTSDHQALVAQHFGNNVHYVKNQKNEGIAKALNQGAQFAIERNCQWLLTMDQDSSFRSNSFKHLIEALDHVSSTDVGILSAVHVSKNLMPRISGQAQEYIKKTMTSGNLLNLHSYLACGEFEEKLFIDYVDHDYNLRLRRLNYKMIRVNSCLLDHNLGEISIHNFLLFKIKTTNHNHVRRYFITRNRLYVIFKHFWIDPVFCLKEFKNYWSELLKIVFIEDDKIRKVRAIVSGTLDWMNGKYGPLKNKS